MTRIAIVGGKLQGTEAAYLARKAGMESLLIDYYEKSPAIGLCDEFLCCDVTQDSKELIDALNRVDFILPANENTEVLDALVRLAEKHHYRLAFDKEAYGVSSSKLLSDRLMHENQIPSPRYFPDCKAPYIVKPSGFSGSEGVKRFNQTEALNRFLSSAATGENWIVQEFLEGPSYSIEVIGKPGSYQTYGVTEIHMDEVYDCKMVTAPCAITKNQEEGFRQIAVRLAELVKLKGIMDVEVIDDHGAFKVLEIDARIPSQTPTVVYHATGVNFVEELMELFCFDRMRVRTNRNNKFCSYEHLLIKDGRFTEHGEHIMSEAGPLTLRKGFFGADEVISDYIKEGQTWRGTFINWADTREELNLKRENMRLSLLGL
ncbi:MAG: 3-methylornithine--L-lysine ligase PylC [Eubacteriales bacterium]|nr:3-methylornithine--L-lysine ligase PylC [Eubacteriales bacterium]